VREIMMKKIVVTGGAGFLGSHLCEKLLASGNEVMCIDNMFTGSKENIKHLISNPDFELIRHDITQPIDIEADQIYNLACPASPVHYQFNPIKTVKTNVMGAINMLETARNTKARILQASTSEIYGDPKIHPQNESYNGNVSPIGIRACYDEGKRVAETLFFDYHRHYSVEIKVMRIFNTYGPRLAIGDGRVVSNFIVQALQNEDITVYGDGSQSRSFCYVDDLIDGMIKLMESSSSFTGPVNIGNPLEFTVLQLAQKIIDLTNSKSMIIFKPLPKDDPVQRKPDISLAKKALDWSPSTQLDEGLRGTIEYFKSVLEKR